jgi:CDP-glucose 4,6-dehydratase
MALRIATLILAFNPSQFHTAMPPSQPMQSFSDTYNGLRVLVTGHTGFKGGWLCHWLQALGAEVHGMALPPTTTPDIFTTSGLERRLASHRFVDIRDPEATKTAIAEIRPAMVFHLAAQPLVRLSYRDPVGTFASNVMGTIHVLEGVRQAGTARACVVVTSDKCYENREWPWGYREDEAFGGHDPYSASKGACEVAVASWRRSFFAKAGVPLASARAGNVIGGGDWSEDRIVCDAVRALVAGRPLGLRNPAARRPWQHVLEPLGGYLLLGQRLLAPDGHALAEGWNFGPSTSSIRPVRELADGLVRAWGSGSWEDHSDPQALHEATWLALSWEKAYHRLGWSPVWDFSRTIAQTVAWYQGFHIDGRSASELIQEQISTYQSDARRQGLAWAN